MSDPTTDVLDRLADLHKQATTERSHFYVASVVRDAAAEIARLRTVLRVNLLRHVPGVSHAEIDAMLEGGDG